MKSVSTPDAALPSRSPNRFILVLQSFCAGIAMMVVTVFLSAFIAIGVAIHSLPKPQGNGGGEVGWDLVTLVHNLPWHWLLLPGVAFAVGFACGLRYFSRART